LEAEGELADAIRLEKKSTKGNSGRVVYLSQRLRGALADPLKTNRPITTTNITRGAAT
jgi:hypothetical protein